MPLAPKIAAPQGHMLYGRCTSICGSSRNRGMSERSHHLSTLSNEILSVMESINFAPRLISIQRHVTQNDVIMI